MRFALFIQIQLVRVMKISVICMVFSNRITAAPYSNYTDPSNASISILTEDLKKSQLDPFTTPQDLSENISQSESKSDDGKVKHFKTNFPHIRFNFEIRFPALTGISSVPSLDGSPLEASTVYDTLTIEYKILPYTKIWYAQRCGVTLAAHHWKPPLQFIPKNPIFGIRFSNLLKIESLKTNQDIYIQPTWLAPYSNVGYHKSFDFGVKMYGMYSFKNSPWILGKSFVMYGSFYDYNNLSNAPIVSGYFEPWVGYRLNPFMFTQHMLTIAFRGNLKSDFIYDHSAPYIQNGLRINFSNTMGISIFINNYIIVTPTFKNTWVTFAFNVSAL